MQPIVTPYEYVGDIPALGTLQLTRLARSFEELEGTPLDFLFPDEIIEERTIMIETIKEGLGIMPLVRFGVPAGNFLEPERIERRMEQPAVVREDDFIDQALVNQMRKAGTMNDRDPASAIIQRRTRALVARHNRTKDVLRAMVLQGGINYTDPRTNVGINVSTQIPAHNLFRYDGWNANVAAGTTITGSQLKAGKSLTNNKNRPEAMLFADAVGNIAIPWTNPQADIVRCLRYLKQYLMNTNKNRYTDIVMSRDLYTLLLENQFIKAYSGNFGVIIDQNTGNFGTANSNRPVPEVTFGPGGDITSIAGLNIILVDTMYRDPVTSEIVKVWPTDLVAVVARNHMSDPSATLGFTHHCMGESPDERPGMWMRTGPDQQPPAVPGRSMQLGNSFLPFAVYPQWICLLTVAETSDIDQSVFFRSDLGYGTFQTFQRSHCRSCICFVC